jgi:dienelactone hydrolase
MSVAKLRRGFFKKPLTWGLLMAGSILIIGWLFYNRDYAGDFKERHGTYAGATVTAVSGNSMFQKSWLTVRNKEGLVVECAMLTPPDDGAKHPAIVLLGGKATGKYAVDYALDVAGVIIVAVDYPYAPRETYTITSFLRDVPAIRKALLDMVPSVMLVIDYLLTRADVDSTSLVILGYSFGAPFVPCIVAHDRRPAAAAMVYGGGDLRSLIAHNVRRYEGETISQVVGALGGLLLHPLEPMRYVGRVSPTPLIMINGTEDEQVPRQNAELLYSAAGQPKTITWLASRHVRPDNIELTRSIVAELKRELGRRGIGGHVFR